MIRPRQRAIERDVLLDDEAPSRDCGYRHRDAALVARVADRDAKVPEPLDAPQVEVLERRRVGADAVQDREVGAALAQEGGSALDLVQRGHPGREDDRLAGVGDRVEEREVDQIGGARPCRSGPRAPRGTPRARRPTGVHMKRMPRSSQRSRMRRNSSSRELDRLEHGQHVLEGPLGEVRVLEQLASDTGLEGGASGT